MIMRDSPMLGGCTNEQITSVKGKNLIVMADYLLSTSRLQHERPEVPQDVFLQCNTTVGVNRVNPST